jgi:hypothetical protein
VGGGLGVLSGLSGRFFFLMFRFFAIFTFSG